MCRRFKWARARGIHKSDEDTDCQTYYLLSLSLSLDDSFAVNIVKFQHQLTARSGQTFFSFFIFFFSLYYSLVTHRVCFVDFHEFIQFIFRFRWMRPSGGTRSLWNELQINDGWFFLFFLITVSWQIICYCNCFLSLIFLVFLRITRLTDMSVRKNSSIHVFKNISKMYAYSKLSLFPFFYIIYSNIFQRFILSNSPLIWNFFIFRIRSWFDSSPLYSFRNAVRSTCCADTRLRDAESTWLATGRYNTKLHGIMDSIAISMRSGLLGRTRRPTAIIHSDPRIMDRSRRSCTWKTGTCSFRLSLHRFSSRYLIRVQVIASRMSGLYTPSTLRYRNAIIKAWNTIKDYGRKKGLLIAELCSNCSPINSIVRGNSLQSFFRSSVKNLRGEILEILFMMQITR